MNNYIHYGSSAFDPELFCPIKNEDIPFLKPTWSSGLWASPLREDGSSDWYHFIQDCPDLLSHKNMKESFIFTLKDDTNVFTIDKPEDFFNIQNFILGDREKTLRKIKTAETSLIPGNVFLDFEAMTKSGIDAIELDLSKNFYCLHYMLYG